MKQKDNLTDVVQQLPKEPAPKPTNPPEPKKPQQVVSSDGEVITLGN